MANSKFPWQQLYRSALLEVDPHKLLQKIETAEHCIRERLREIDQSDPRKNVEERLAIDDALRALSLIRRTPPE